MKNNTRSWNERMETVQVLKENLEQHIGDRKIIAELMNYINDAKWEVRQKVAECMLFIPPEHIFLFTKLKDDDNAYVAAAAKRCMERSSLVTEPSRKSEKPTLFQNVDKIRQKFGEEAVTMLDKEFTHAYEVTVGAVGHDIRGLLSPIQYYLDKSLKILVKTTTEKELQEARRGLLIVSERIGMIEQMTNDIRDLSKRTPAGRSLESISDLLHHAVGMETDNMHSRKVNIDGIVIEYDISEDIFCRVSRDAILRVFRNFIKNAFESFQVADNNFRDSGKITIVARSIQAGIEITFVDNGAGMDEEALSIVRQFRPRGTSKKKTGTGFGMAIAYSKVRDHNGDVDIQSQPEIGTTVKVFLPYKE